MNPLNHQEVALCGTNLVEAGAGTGKTWAITALYLRLLLEKELLPEEILVVLPKIGRASCRERV